MVLMTGYNRPEPPSRSAGKYGRNPGHVPNGLHDFTFYAAGPLPKAPAAVVVPNIAPLGMDGNDQYGDCGVAGTNHGEMFVAHDTGNHQLNLTDEQVVQYYLTYTGGQDNGVVLADFLAYVKKTGWFGRKIAGYAPVSITDYATLEFAVNAYGYAYTGIQVTDLMEQAFSAHQPWTPETFLNGQVQGGHCVPIVGYDAQHLYVVTWGAIQAITFSAWHLMAEEAWAVLWGEVPAGGLTSHGVNLAALEADLSKLAQ